MLVVKYIYLNALNNKEGGIMFVGEKLKTIRKERKLSQGKLASMLNITRTTLSHWETGRHKPSRSDIEKILRILKVHYSDVSNITISKKINVGSIVKFDNSLLNSYKKDFYNNINKFVNDIDSAFMLFDAMLNSRSPQDYFYIKNVDNKYIKASKTFLVLCNKDENFEVSGTRDSDYFNYEIAVRNAKEDIKLMSERKSKIEKEYFLNNDRIFRVRKNPIYSQDGNNEIAGLLCSFTDITNEHVAAKDNSVLVKTLNQANIAIHILSKKYKKYSKVEYISDSVESVFNYSAQDFKDCESDFIESIMLESFKNDYKKNRYKNNTTFEYMILDKNGQRKWIETSFSKVQYMAKDCLLMIHRNITEDKKKQLQLQLFSKLMARNKFTGIVCKEILPDGTKKLIEHNEKALEILELSDSEFLKAADYQVLESMYEKDKFYVKSKVDNAIKTENSMECEFRIVKRNGEMKWVREQLSFMSINDRKYFTVFLEDITFERERFKIFDIMPIGIAVYDIELDKYIYVNNKICEIYGYTSRDYRSKSIKELTVQFHPDDSEIRDKIICNYLPEGKMEWEVDYRVIVNNQVKYLQTKRKKTLFENRDCLIINVNDITKEKLKEIELERTKRVLQLKNAVLENIKHSAFLIKNLTVDKVMEVDAEFTRITGFTLEDAQNGLIGDNNRILPEDLKIVQSIWDRYFETGEVHSVNYRMRTKDERVITIRERFRKVVIDDNIYYVETIEDLTEELKRKQEFEKVKEKEFHYNIFEKSEEIGCYIVNDKVFEKYNAGMKNICGYAMKEINKIGWRQLIEEEEYNEAQKVFDYSLKHNTLFNVVYSIKCKDGTVKRIKDMGEFAEENKLKRFYGILFEVK